MVAITPGIEAEVPKHILGHLYSLAMDFGKKLGEPTWLILDPAAKRKGLEDEGRTLRMPFAFHRKIWMIKEDWSHVPKEVREAHGVYGDVVVSIMFPEEY